MEPFVKLEKPNRPVLFTIESWMEQFSELTVGFTSRNGGVSLEPFTTLNCGLHVNDVPEHVVRNRELVAEALEQPFEAFTYAEQVHGNEVTIVSLEERGSGRASREAAIQAKDGFITKETGIVLCAQFADCVPLFFYDPIKRVVGLAHAGWKGTVLNISKATIALMTNTFGSSASDIRTAIGPSIGACCYEVDQSVADRVKAVLDEVQAAPEEHSTVIVAKENSKYMLNLQELNRKLLQQAGILSSHIEVSQLCTSCNTDKFFSHRKEGGATGRMIAWIGLT
ncbi:peptidoglycan editing factor PgeF [Paenibacillus sp. HWE-109]|uniref:peptidoglycan editing factor PgeF n=1 Tax=Paenibacillus sp. HWE-109 TaxID=1306526 RepID=UPI001EDFF895|nr:peptidoglycan editing factor PgeF [Paenibacillus sp. HWE-109]UKS30264.1 peptidoglycan editing factor PgeF [Paenibacillus sp. HWE-109]